MIFIIDKFDNLPDKKRIKIINAALAVFAKYGYKKSTTYEIAKNADISKSLLFHYFGNKLNLYTYLYQHSTELLVEDLMKQIDFTNPSIIERFSHTLKVKMKLIKKNPDLFEFLKSATLEEDKTVQPLIKKITLEERENQYKIFYSGIDYNLFRPEIDINLAIKTMNYTFEKWTEEFLQRLKLENKSMVDIDDNYIMDDINKYIKLFECSFYK